MARLLVVAACALIDGDGRVLLARRPAGKQLAGLWEFPGGKLDDGETPEGALVRELKEELGIDSRGFLPRADRLFLHEFSGLSSFDATLRVQEMEGCGAAARSGSAGVGQADGVSGQ